MKLNESYVNCLKELDNPKFQSFIVGDEVVPSGALRVDKEKIKPFLRDIKIQSLLDK